MLLFIANLKLIYICCIKEKLTFYSKIIYCLWLNYEIVSLNLRDEIIKYLDFFISNRKRLISEYEIQFKERDVYIKRVPSYGFVQVDANSLELLDYRHSVRKFKELPYELLDENLIKNIRFVFVEIKKNRFL